MPCNPRGMLHFTGRGARRTLLFHDWTEAVALWRRLSAIPGLRGLALMPDHFHSLNQHDVRLELGHALSGYVRWRNARRRRDDPGIAPLPPGELLADAQKRQRSVRYVHLNPCRGQLCDDPLAWPVSTHRDAVGLAIGPVLRTRTDPAGFHRYVSSDPTVRVTGTDLPGDQWGAPTAEQVLDAVSSLARAPVRDLMRRGPARTLYLAAAAALGAGTQARIAALVGVDPTRVRRAEAPLEHIRAVRRVVGDPRFAPLDEAFLPHLPRWRAYIGRKGLVVPR